MNSSISVMLLQIRCFASPLPYRSIAIIEISQSWRQLANHKDHLLPRNNNDPFDPLNSHQLSFTLLNCVFLSCLCANHFLVPLNELLFPSPHVVQHVYGNGLVNLFEPYKEPQQVWEHPSHWDIVPPQADIARELQLCEVSTHYFLLKGVA